MYPSKLNILCFLAIAGIIATVALTVALTGNALALLGLVLVPHLLPPLVPEQQACPDADGREEPGIGFTADIEGQ